GLTWMDHEFGTGALDKHAVGWDWFAVQLDDGRDLMFAMVRTDDGRNATLGTLIERNRAKRDARLGDATRDVLGVWRSPHSGAEYPSGWRLRIPSADLDLRVTPYLVDQELPLAVIYWEGAVKVEGTAGGKPIGGSGYAELTGY